MNKLQHFVLLVIMISFTLSCASGKSKKPIDAFQIDENIQTSVQNLSKKIKKIYVGDIAPAKRKVAVLTFVNENGDVSNLSLFISNTLQTNIFDPKIFSLLERERVDSLLSEYEFNTSGLISSVDTKKIGNLIGADIVVVGTISQKVSEKSIPYFVITARIVDLGTGEILAIDSSNCLANDELIDDYNTLRPGAIKTIAGAYRLSIRNVEVKSTKNGNAVWDTADGSMCDVKISLKTNSTNTIFSNIFYDTNVIKNDAMQAKVILEDKDSITISLWDTDILDDDLVARFIVNDEQIKNSLRTRKPIKLKSENILNLELVLEKI